MVKRNHWRYRLIPCHSLHLNHSGDPAKDQIWPEYSQLLCLSDYETIVTQKCLPYLHKALDGWDEFCTGVATESTITQFDAQAGWIEHELWADQSYSVDLVPFKETPSAYLEQLSANTRYQIRRTRKDLERLGQLKLNVITDTHDLLSTFNHIGEVHKRQWGQDSGFHNTTFVNFHQRLIQDSALPVIHTLTLNGQCIAAHYNLNYQRGLYFYLGFAEKTLSPKIKPGLLLHAEVIQRCIADGLKLYDFMAGDMQYKRQLSTRQQPMRSIRLSQPRCKYRIEHQLRLLKQRYSRQAPREPSQTPL
ncbi:MAG: GNAT family N-acetyltransferase [Saccharospirillum sp.]